MTRWVGAVLGGLTFLGAHTVEALKWRSWFEPASSFAAWFLNSGRAVAFTVLCLFIVSMMSSAFGSADQRDSLVRGAYFSGGAVVAMTIVLFEIGPGPLAPIVWTIGAAVIAASAVIGSLGGWAFRASF
jgi:hypothetical protein